MHIFLWDNSGASEVWEADWLVRSSRNAGCWPRWYLASQATTPLVATLDDDLLPADEHFFRDLTSAWQQEPAAGRIIGPYGVVLEPGKSYRRCSGRSTGGNSCIPADIIKGRVMLLAREDLRSVLPIAPANVLHDDIAVSGLMAAGRTGHHRWARHFRHRLTELPDRHAMSSRPEHFAEREEMRRLYFP